MWWIWTYEHVWNVIWNLDIECVVICLWCQMIYFIFSGIKMDGGVCDWIWHSCCLFSCRLHDRNWDSILFFYLFFPDGYMTGILMQIPVGQDSWRGIPVGLPTGLQVASVNRRPSGIAVRNTILSVDRREQMSFPVELFLTMDSWRLPVRNTILSVDRREQMSFPVELFLTVDSWRLPVRNRIPDGFRLIPDGFRPTGKSISLVVCSRCGLRLVTHKN